RGTLDGISVARVELELADTKVVNGSQVSVNGIIVHYVDGDTSHLEVGASIVGAVDILRRRKIEALHSASHIMEEFLFAEISGFERVGSYVNEIKDRSDYNTASRLTADQLALIECKINEFISLDYPIETWLENDIKYWKCGPFKTMCSGTHPPSTRHIGRVSLKRKNQGRGLERIETTLVER
ncbi:putative alanyl-tRNA synthetase, partial [Pseudomonas amygdali pv. mori str. 301020]